MKSPANKLIEINPAQLISALMDFQIAIRKVALYGFSHPIVPKLTTNLKEQFNPLIQQAETLSFVIAKNDILYNERPLSSQHPVIVELARTLHQLNLIQFTFKKAVSEEDLLAFLKFIVETRSAQITQEDPLLSEFHKTVDSISLQRVSFKEVVSLSDSKDPDTPKTSGPELWRNLVHHLENDHLPESVKQVFESEKDTPPDPDQIAAIVNDLYAHNNHKPAKNNLYDAAIVNYLKERASQQQEHEISSSDRAQDLCTLFSNLREDVRHQLFRFATKEQDGGKMAIESLLEMLPPKQLPEVLKHIQLSEQTVSKPMFSLLKKMVSLSGPDDMREHLLSSRFENHEGLIEELLSDRSDREYYPAQHRALLDSELSDQMAAMQEAPNAGINPLVDAETDYHLALILIELLDGPIYSEVQMKSCVDYMKTLLVQGLGENTQSITIQTLKTLLKNCGSNKASDRTFWKNALKMVLAPEILLQLISASVEKSEEEFQIQDLITVAGSELFPVLLQVLENESNLSTRKQILHFIVQCGRPVIPLVVEQLSSEKWYVVRNMLMILKDLRAEEALPEMACCMTHESGKVRLMALQALMAAGPESDELLEAAKIGLQDEDEKISKTAADLIAERSHISAGPLVSALLQHNTKGTRQTIWQIQLIRAIERSGSSHWLPVLEPLLKWKFFGLFCWGRERLLQKTLQNAIVKLKKEGAPHAG